MSISIIVVDDEPDVAELFRQRFRRELRSGTWVLHFALSGREALSMVTADVEPAPSVLLSDINMPEMDGLQLLREVKSCRPELPVIMITAYDDEERRHTANVFGAADFINKPLDFDQLKQRLLTFATAGQPS